MSSKSLTLEGLFLIINFSTDSQVQGRTQAGLLENMCINFWRMKHNGKIRLICILQFFWT